MKKVLLLLFLIHSAACAAPVEVDEYHWTGVDRIVAVGDIHGDYENYMKILEAAGLVNQRGKWVGGETHFVQTGDIPDRGPDTLKIIEHLDKLATQAKRKGGRVHSLIGNHEAMNVYGDLRYVTDEEFRAFAKKGSEALIDRYFELVMQDLQARDPDAFAQLPENYRQEWDKTHPPGWVEHQQAWNPAWNPDGELFQRTLDSKVAIQVNDLVFLHGGLSGYYCQNSLESLTDMVVDKLRNYDPANTGILEDPYGPLWYRGLSGRAPEAAPETVAAILERHNARHIVVGHTPTGGAILTRYDGAVIQIDTGLSKAYGGRPAYLEVTPEGMFAGYPEGKVALPADDAGRVDYLEQVFALYPRNGDIKMLLDELKAGDMAADLATENSGENGEKAGAEAAPAMPTVQVPICDMRQ